MLLLLIEDSFFLSINVKQQKNEKKQQYRHYGETQKNKWEKEGKTENKQMRKSGLSRFEWATCSLSSSVVESSPGLQEEYLEPEVSAH